jgi:hypothetical protein
MKYSQKAIDSLRQELEDNKAELRLDRLKSIGIGSLYRIVSRMAESLIWMMNAEQTLSYIDNGDTPERLVRRCLEFCSSDSINKPNPEAIAVRSAIVMSVIDFKQEDNLDD